MKIPTTSSCSQNIYGRLPSLLLDDDDDDYLSCAVPTTASLSAWMCPS